MMIEIFVDLRCLQDPAYRDRGVGQLTRVLMRYAADFAPHDIELIGLIDPEMEGLATQDRALVSRVSTWYRVPSHACILVQFSPMTHPQHHLLPFIRSRDTTKAAVVYDFIPYDEPSHYFHTMRDRINYHTTLSYLATYDLFFPISDYSAERLTSVLQASAHRVFTIGAPVRKELTEAKRPGGVISEETSPYFLVIAGDDWRKNVECAIVAFGRLSKRPHRPAGLVIVGPYSVARRSEIVATLPAFLRGQVLFRDGLTDQELASLYSGATATICPSRVEGFSLPVVEAVSCGSPVLASDCAAQVELVPDRDNLFGADDPERLSALMAELLENTARRIQLLERQSVIASKFTERAVAERFWPQVFKFHASAVPTGPSIAIGSRPRLAFVTPYPPDASGVADYTARSLRDICEHADVDLFTDAAGARVQPGVRFAGRISSFPYFSRRYDRVISVVGNSDFHTSIIEYIRDFGGACIEHDNRLADFYHHVRGYKVFAQMAGRGLKRRISRAEARAGLLNPEVFKSLFFDEIVHSAQPFIVHSRGIQKNVNAIYGVDAEYLPFCPYREFSDDELSDASRAAARAGLGIEPGQIAIGSFGAPGPSKAVNECIWALEQLHAWGIKAEFYLVGETGRYIESVLPLVRKLRLEPFVHFMTTRISDEIYRNFLIGLDVAIQLRTHGLGGLSGALLDAIACGLPAVANANLADAMEAPSYVRRVPDNLSPTLIAEQISELVKVRAGRACLEDERKRYIDQHSFKHYAERLMGILGVGERPLGVTPR